MRYVIARSTLNAREMAYRFYIAEGVKMIAENTARSVGGMMFSKSFNDIMNPPKEETRTPKDIIDKIKKGLSEL